MQRNIYLHVGFCEVDVGPLSFNLCGAPQKSRWTHTTQEVVTETKSQRYFSRDDRTDVKEANFVRKDSVVSHDPAINTVGQQGRDVLTVGTLA